MKICMIADTHGLTKHLSLPSCDLLLIAGDVMNTGKKVEELYEFLEWVDQFSIEHKVLVPGNHDWLFQDDPDLAISLCLRYDITTLIDEGVEVEGIKIYGSPWQPAFCNWAFNLERGSVELMEKWTSIPDDTDILVTHGAPALPHGNRLGDYHLLEQIVHRIKPKLHVFGHLHEGYGIHLDHGVTFINASICNDSYNPINQPIMVNL